MSRGITWCPRCGTDLKQNGAGLGTPAGQSVTGALARTPVVQVPHLRH
ncbi:hypothetical protein H180DRAFT_00410 [Streptomyces sp. WMMB 322]|nr:hypothetical protein H180DRAFT_00410 [Streptomyces sp. WMMB 322]